MTAPTLTRPTVVVPSVGDVVLRGVLAALAFAVAVAAAMVLLGPRTVDAAGVAEIVRAGDVAPTAVTCPDDVPVEVGATFGCSATLDGQAVRYLVRQDDDHGGVTVSDAGFVVLSRVEASIVEQLRTRTGFAVVAECGPAGREIVVGGPGTTVDCTVTAAGNAADAARIVGIVTDDAGTVAF